MSKKDEDLLDDDFDFDNNSNESSFDFEPQKMDSTTFKQRNDPQELLERYRLQLMNAYKVKEVIKDDEGKEKEIYKIKLKKNTKPKANKQGVEDIISYVEKFINNHTVQGNINSMEEFRNFMRYVSNDLTTHFMAMRKDWEIPINEIDTVIASAINLIELFLTRTLFNEERKSYGESYKETTNTEIRPKDKLNMIQKIGSFMGWK